MHKYARQTRILVAVDCILFGFDGQDMKILLIKRGLEPEKGKWSLMGGFIQPNESLDDASKRVLYALTGLSDVYMEQLYTFGNPLRDPIERTLSVGYFALLDLTKFNPTLTAEYHAEWFSIHKFPSLIFDHNEIVAMARQRLRQKAATSPVIFELLP
ncbi:MAG TPA: NUDIX hydrolase, partial [Phnomibacter sp.]|nr:NUDIX hydrolase [Phnomibacter sp.]